MRNIKFNAAEYGNAMLAFRRSLVSAETMVDNASATIGRETLAGLLDGDTTPAAIAIAAYDAFKPRTAKGKDCEPKLQGELVLSVSSLRNAKGGDSARKALDAIFNIAAIVSLGGDSDGANAIVPMVDAFVNDEKSAHSSVRTLEAAVNEAWKAESRRKLPKGDDGDDEGESEGDDNGDNAADDTPPTLAETMAYALERFQAASEAERNEASEAIAAFFDAVFAESETADKGDDVAQAA